MLISHNFQRIYVPKIHAGNGLGFESVLDLNSFQKEEITYMFF